MIGQLDIHALVTGGTSGIGEATVRKLAFMGARVSFCGRRELLGRRIEAELRSVGSQARFIQADVREHAQVEQLFYKAEQAFGVPDLAFNNAGISHATRRTGDLALEDLEDVFATNFRGLWLCVRAELARMSETGRGLIFNMASILGMGESAWLSAYGASKHAVIGLTLSTAKEYQGTNLKIVALAPGPVNTQMYQRALEESGGDRARFAGGHPDGPVWSPDEIAGIIAGYAAAPDGLSSGDVIALPGPAASWGPMAQRGAGTK